MVVSAWLFILGKDISFGASVPIAMSPQVSPASPAALGLMLGAEEYTGTVCAGVSLFFFSFSGCIQSTGAVSRDLSSR